MSHKQRALGVVRRRLILIGVLEKTSDLALTHSLPVNRILTTLWAIWGGVQRITHKKHICVPWRVQNFLLRESSYPSSLTARAPLCLYLLFWSSCVAGQWFSCLLVFWWWWRQWCWCLWALHSLCIIFPFSLFHLRNWFQILNFFVLGIFYLAKPCS